MKNLIKDIIQGDKSAFDQLVKKFSPLVNSLIYKVFYRHSFNPHKEDVEDIHNTLFLSLMEDNFRRLRIYKGNSSLTSYISIITINHVRDFLRRQKGNKSIDSDDNPPPLIDIRARPDKAIELTEKERIVNKVIKTLPTCDQIFLRLIYWEELSPKEVTQVINISMIAYYNRKSRIMKKIKKILKDTEEKRGW